MNGTQWHHAPHFLVRVRSYSRKLRSNYFTSAKDARIAAADSHDQIMEIAEVVMVMGQQDTVVFNGPGQVHGIVLATHSSARGQGHVMPRVTEQAHKERPGGVVVQV